MTAKLFFFLFLCPLAFGSMESANQTIRESRVKLDGGQSLTGDEWMALGAALHERGEYILAVEAFTVASVLDPGLAEQASLEIKNSKAAISGQRVVAQIESYAAELESVGEQLRRETEIVSQAAQRVQTTPAERPLTGSIGLTLGYGTSLDGRNRDLFLPGPTESDDTFIDLELYLAYRLYQKNGYSLTPFVSFATRNHFDATTLDYDSLTAALSGSYLDQTKALIHTLDLGTSQLWFDSEYFSNALFANYQVVHRLSDTQALGAVARLDWADYQTLTGVNDRDGEIYSGSLFYQHSFSRLTANLSVNFGHQTTEGTEYENSFIGISPSLSAQLPYDISGRLFFSYTHAPYEKASGFLTNGDPRSDDRLRTGLSLSKELVENWRLSLSYTYSEQDSNVTLFTYDQHLFTSKLVYSF
ncbi:MAG: surface lipoprotein assembly modifier [Verrucomicrobiota bacterium]